MTNCTRSIRQPYAKEEGRREGGKKEGKGREGKERKKRKERRKKGGRSLNLCWETILHGSPMYLHTLRVRH